MPAPHPPEFRQRAVELGRLRERPIHEIAASLGMTESCLRTWVARADTGAKPGLCAAYRTGSPCSCIPNRGDLNRSADADVL